jgi:chromosome segregation ATPase
LKERSKLISDIAELKEMISHEKNLFSNKKKKLGLWKTKFAEETRDMRDQLSILEGEKGVFERRLNQQDAVLNEEAERNQSLEGELMRMRNEIDAVQSQVVESREQCHLKEGLLIESRLRIEMMDKENSDLKQACNETSRQKAELGTTLEKARADEKNKRRAKVGTERERIQEKDRELEQLSAEFYELRNHYGISQTQNSDMRAENAELRRKVEQLEFENKKVVEIESDFDHTKTAYTTMQADLRARTFELEERTAIIQDYEKRTLELLHQNEKLDNELERRA